MDSSLYQHFRFTCQLIGVEYGENSVKEFGAVALLPTDPLRSPLVSSLAGNSWFLEVCHRGIGLPHCVARAGERLFWVSPRGGAGKPSR